jgi:hypothetical protein
MTQVKYLRRFGNQLYIPGDGDDEEEKSVLLPIARRLSSTPGKRLLTGERFRHVALLSMRTDKHVCRP